MNNTKTKATPSIGWVEEIARLMDNKFRVPGTRFRFGLDPILGIVPGLGDAAALAISGGLVLAMIRHGASRKVIILMTLNVILDATIGSIPLLGNIFDFFFKANTRNLRLLKAHYEEGKYQGRGTWIIFVVGALFLGALGIILWGTWEAAEWLFESFRH